MTTNAGQISIDFPTPPRHCAAGAELQSVVRSPSTPSASTASSSPPPEAPKRSHPNVQNVLRSHAAAFATHALAFKIKPPLRFPHSS
jgi:hypothetical protein